MGQQGLKKSLSVAVACSLLAGSCVGYQPDYAEAAKKATLKTKKMTLYVGEKKAIKIKAKKAKAKYVFRSSKKKVAKVTKKGMVAARKKGIAKITVTEKNGTKVRRLGRVRVVVTANEKTPEQTGVPSADANTTASAVPTTAASAVPTAVASAVPTMQPTTPPTVVPTENPYENLEWEKIDLSTWTAFGMDDNCMLDTNTGIFNAKNQEFFGFELSQDIAEGQYIVVRVTGNNAGAAGFRSWLVDSVTTTCTGNSDLYLFTKAANADFTVGDFEVTYKLPASADCNYLFFKGPAYGTNIEDLSITSIEVSYSEKVEVNRFEPTKEQNAVMVADSLLSTGNNAKIKAVMKKARAGEDVTLAYIGGSVTEGAGAAPNAKCYAQLSCEKFAQTYGTGENVHFVNAGMSGTPSSLGIVRYEKDVLGQMVSGQTPDILFVEFAVNDSGECTDGGAYEGLIRRALASGSAVILVFSVFRDNWNMQSTYIPYGEHYDLPMISMKDAVSAYMDEVDGFRKWYFSDAYHPTNAGYQLTAECIMNLFDAIDKEEVEEDNIPDVSAFEGYKTDAFEGTVMMGPATIETLLAQQNSSLLQFNAGGFSETDAATGTYLYDSSKEKFPENWMHTAESGSDALTAKVKCKNLLVVYKLSNSESTGTAELYVDGKLKVTMNAYNRDGWNNATTVLAFREDEAAEHSIQIKMADGNEDKEFTLLALGYN